MDLYHPRLTMRDIITAMSRPTHGRYLHFVEQEQQDGFFHYSKTVTDDMLKQLVLTKTGRGF
jgi:hypothetical protein